MKDGLEQQKGYDNVRICNERKGKASNTITIIEWFNSI